MKLYLATSLAFLLIFIVGCQSDQQKIETETAITNTNPEQPTYTATPLTITNTPEATPTISLTPSPSSTSTPEFITFNANNYPAKVYLNEMFDNELDLNIWESYLLTAGNPDKAKTRINDGKLAVTLEDKGLYQFFIYKPEITENVKLTLNAENFGTSNNYIGLLWGIDGENSYEFGITSGGEWIFFQHTEKGSELLSTGGSKAIRKGDAANEISITTGGKPAVIINGENIGIDLPVTESDLSGSQVGFFVSSLYTPTVYVDIDSFIISAPYNIMLSNTPVSPDTNAPHYYTEEFSHGMGYWSYNDSFGGRRGDTATLLYFEDGKFMLDLPVGESYGILSQYEPYDYEDTTVTLKIANPEVVIGDPKKPKNDMDIVAGVICRKTDAGWYDFLVSSSGTYWIQAATNDSPRDYWWGKLFPEVLRQGTIPFRKGEVSEITGVCKGNQLTLLVNGVEIITIEDSTYKIGKVGFSMVSPGMPNNQPVHMEIERITVAEP
jgi:hypothetical protein